jgi:trehalose-6-phosphate synthase
MSSLSSLNVVFLQVPNIVRRVAKEENLKCRIGFFMHIPFPPWDMVKIHPWKDFFLQGPGFFSPQLR